MAVSKSKHTQICKTLVDRLRESPIEYNIIGMEEKYKSSITGEGECDVYAISNGNLLCFEVKTFDREKNKQKALHQLRKDKYYYTHKYNVDKVYTFYVSGFKNGNAYRVERVFLGGTEDD